MEKILKIAESLGEENVQKIKDGITEMLLDYLKEDLENMEDCIINYNELFEDVRDEVFANIRDKMINKYTAEIEKKFDELLSN